jgi:hydrogenase/urease accessory protein HupE
VLGFALDYPAMQLGGRELRRTAKENRAVMAEAAAGRFVLVTDGQRSVPSPLTFQNSEFLPDRNAIRVYLHYSWQTPPRQIAVETGRLFPVDPNHTVFVTVYDSTAGTMVREAILNRSAPTLSYDVGTAQSTLSVMRQFVREGVHHIFIGPDHILFIIGLLLLGGGSKRLLKIVTAFTLAHSITLVLATLNILSPSTRLVEPAIALSIVFVGIHSLSHLWGRDKGPDKTPEENDLRLPLAFCFGLIHGFGFASVLRELELPHEALGWSLFSFNIGVELGQACIVLAVAPLLAVIARRNERAGRTLVLIGSWGVILAGAYWFGQRLTA